jgi:predicted GNAT family N-acyltransferase
MQLVAKKFDELTTIELYEMLKARSAIFLFKVMHQCWNQIFLNIAVFHLQSKRGKITSGSAC